jgi:hypothetical protein
MRFRDARPLLPSIVLMILVGAYLWIDPAAPENPSRPAATNQSGTRESLRLEEEAVFPPGGQDAKLASVQKTVPTPPNDSTGLVAKLQENVQALQSSNKALSDQVGALAARLDSLEKARAEVREQPQTGPSPPTLGDKKTHSGKSRQRRGFW